LEVAMRKAQVISTVIEIVGMFAVVAGAAFIYWPAAAILGGICLMLIGYALGVDSEAS
jgi:hypothetical protein